MAFLTAKLLSSEWGKPSADLRSYSECICPLLCELGIIIYCCWYSTLSLLCSYYGNLFFISIFYLFLGIFQLYEGGHAALCCQGSVQCQGGTQNHWKALDLKPNVQLQFFSRQILNHRSKIVPKNVFRRHADGCKFPVGFGSVSSHHNAGYRLRSGVF